MKLQHVIFVLLILFSCNSEKKDRDQEFDNERAAQKINCENIINQYSANILNRKSLVNKFSYELEKELLGKNIACIANIFDIRETKNDQYILFAKGDNLSLELQLNQKTLDRILEYRSILSKKDDGWFGYYGLSETEILFVIKPIAFSKRYGLYKTVGDFDYNIEYEGDDEGTSTEIELIDYTIELEVTNDGFYIKAECVDLTLADKIYWDLE